MICICKRHIKKIVFILTTIFIITLLPPMKAKAASVTVSTSSLSIQAGGSASFYIQPNGATGRVNISSDGPVSVSSSSVWVEGSSASITVYGNSVGNGHVYVTLASVGADDGSGDLNGSYTINVSVYKAQNNNNNNTNKNNTNTNKNNTSKNTGNNDADDSEGLTEEIPVLNVTIDEIEYSILTDLTEVTLPEGFTLSEGNYGLETVPVARYTSKDKEEIVLYALSSVEGGDIIFKTFNEAKGEFEEPNTIKQGTYTYYLLGIPSTLKLPEDYEIKETALGDITTNAIVQKFNSKSEFVYIYAVTNGVEGYYSYDLKEGTIQRCPYLESLLTPEVEEVETKNTVNMTMILIIGVAALAVLIMGIILICVLARRKKEEKLDEGDYYHHPVDSLNEHNDATDVEEIEKSDEINEIDVIDLTEDIEESDGLDVIDLSKPEKKD